MFRAAVLESELKILPWLYTCMLTAFLQICGFDDQLLEVLINRIQQTALGYGSRTPSVFCRERNPHCSWKGSMNLTC